MSDNILQGVIDRTRRPMESPKTATVELINGRIDTIEGCVEDTFIFYPVPNQPGQNFVALVLTDNAGGVYKYPMAAVIRWSTRPMGN